MDLQWFEYLFVVLAGFAAGYINTLAGSGSLITLSLMLFLGIPSTIANASNRVGVLFQTMSSATNFQRQGVLDFRGSVYLAIPAVAGSIIGARMASRLDEALMQQVIGGIMLLMLFVILLRPKRWLEGTRAKFEGRPSFIQLIIFFAIGVYGGFIQAGVGVFLLAGLVLSAGYNLVYANAVKTLVVLLFTIPALIIFVMEGQVDWLIGIALAIGNATGGWFAAKMAVERGAIFVRYVLIAVVVLSAVRLLGVFDFVMGLF
ncbi:MAG: sulfite exporter TauE/SafE family protein [Candidatus Promineifilaceae bacterium]